jgi:hypothetical protein
MHTPEHPQEFYLLCPTSTADHEARWKAVIQVLSLSSFHFLALSHFLARRHYGMPRTINRRLPMAVDHG